MQKNKKSFDIHKKWLKYQHQFDASSSNGRTRHSGCWYLGSNPGEAAIKSTLNRVFFIFKFPRKYAAADFLLTLFLSLLRHTILYLCSQVKNQKKKGFTISVVRTRLCGREVSKDD